MAPTELVSTRHAPKALYICAAVLCVLAIAGRIAYEQISWAHADLVKWRTTGEAEKEAIAQHKPMLYYFTADWCGPCKRLKGECFANAEIAETINSKFIPVMVVDRQMEEGKNPPAVKKLEKRYRIDAFPSVVLVHWELLDADADDVYSASSYVHELLRSDHWYLPKKRGGADKEGFKEYLRVAQIWTKLPASRGQVRWLPAKDLAWAPKSKVKPTLIVVLTQRHRESDQVRTRFLDDEKASAYLNQYFDCYLLEFSRAGSSETQEMAEEARRRYGVRNLPAFIVLNSQEREPHVNTGFSSRNSTLEFLERATHGKTKLPKLTDWDEDEDED